MPNEQCEICGGSGLLPFTLPDGTVSKHAKVFCECYETHLDDHRRALRPEDIDFSVSYSVYRSFCQLHGWQDPGSDYLSEPERPQEQVIIHRHSDLSKQEHDMLQQAVLKADHLEKQLNEHMKPRKKPETYGYRGIR